MVFESIIVAILKKYIGKYVKNLDSNNLSIGLWSGEATLTNLELKEEALLEFDLPVSINSGYIGKLSLNIPWKTIYTSPVVVTVSDVYVLVGPQCEKPYDEVKERQSELQVKQKQLLTIEKGEKKRHEQPTKNREATLTNLELKEEALLEFDLPVSINSGYIGKLSLNIPWKTIYTSPVVVTVSDVYVLVGPQCEKPYDEVKERQSELQVKQKQLLTIEKGEKKRHEQPTKNREATLTNLELKEEALLEFDLPVSINSGYIGKLSLNIPWKTIYTSPVVVTVSDVYVLVGPQCEKPYDEVKERQSELQVKQKQLLTIEKGEKKRHEQPTKNTGNHDDTLTEKLTAQIIKNIQIHISQIHIRYEDKITMPTPFAFGMTLQNLKAETVDQNWLPVIVDSSIRKIHKILVMTNLSIYWNTEVAMLIKDSNNWKALMKSQISRPKDELKHEFILRPLSFTVQAMLDQDAKVLMQLPKFLVDVILKDLSLELSRPQFKGIIQLVESFERMSLNQQYRKYKPTQKVKKNPKAWWRYSYTCIMETMYYPWTWERIQRHRENYKTYVALYRKYMKVEYLNEEKLIVKIKSKLKKVEEVLDVPNILIARKQAQNEFEYEKLTGIEPIHRTESSGLLNWLGFGSSESEEGEEEIEIKSDIFSLAALSEAEKDELYTAIGYTNETAHPVYKKEYIRSNLSFHLDNCSLTLKKNSTRQIASFTMQKLSAQGTERPGSDGLGFKFSLESLKLIGDTHSKTVDIVATKNQKELITFAFEVNPINIDADYSLILNVEPLDIIYNKEIAEAVGKFFVLQNNSKMSELSERVNARLEEISNASRAGIEYSIMHNKSTYLDVTMKSPTVILPHEEITDQNDRLLHIYFGDVKIATNLRSSHKERTLKEATESDLKTMFYHQTIVRIADVHIGIADKCDSKTHFIIPPSSVEVTVYRSLTAGYKNFPDFKIYTILPELTVNLSEDRIAHVTQAASYFVSLSGYQDPCEKANSQSSQNKKPGSIVSKQDLAAVQEVLSQQSNKAESSKDTSTDPDKALSTESYDSNLALFDRTKLIASFQLKKLAVSYALKHDVEICTQVELTLKDIHCEVETHMWDTSIKAKLKEVHLVTQKDSHENLTYMLRSRESEDLIQVAVQQADISGPAFHTKFNRVENNVTIVFGVMKINLMEQLVITVLKSIQSLLKLISSVSTPQAITNTPLETIQEEGNGDVHEKTSLKKVEDAVNMNVFLCLHFQWNAIELTLANLHQQDIALVDVRGLNSSVRISNDCTKVDARLEMIQIRDVTRSEQIEEILAVHDKELFECKITQHQNVPRSSVLPDLEINASMGKLNFKVVPSFICDLVTIVDHVTSVWEPTAANEVTTSSPSSTSYKDFMKLKFDVHIKAPAIVLPVSSSSADHLLFIDLGDLHLQNALLEVDNRITDTISIKLKELKLISVYGSNSRNVIEPVMVAVTCRRSLDVGTDNCVEIDFKLPVLSAKIFDDDITQVATTIDNIYVEFSSLKRDFTADSIRSAESEPIAIDSQQAYNLDWKVSAEINQIQIQTFADEKKLLFDFNAHSTSFLINQNSSKLHTKVTLKSLSLIDHFITDESNLPTHLFSSAHDKDLLIVSYSQDNITKANDILCQLDEVIVIADDRAFKDVVEYIQNIERRTSQLSQRLTSNIKEGGVSTEDVKQDAGSHLNIACHLEKLAVYWRLNEQRFAATEVQGLTLNVKMEDADVSVTAKLSNLHVEDLRANLFYPQIILLEDENLLSLEVSLQHKDGEHVESIVCTKHKVATVWLRVGRLKLVFLYKFLMDILSCIQPFLELTNPKDISSISNQPIHQVNESGNNKESKVEDPLELLLLQLDIDITAPYVIFPECSTSKSYLSADLGKFVVTNVLEDHSTEGKQDQKRIDNIKAVLTNVNLMMSHSGNDNCKLTKELSATVFVKRHLNVEDANKLTILVHVMPVLIFCSDVDLKLLMTIFQSNFGEHVPTKDYQRHEEKPITQLDNVLVDVDVNAEELTSCNKDGLRHSDINLMAIEIPADSASLSIDIMLDCELFGLHLSSKLLFKDELEDTNINFCKLSATKFLMKLNICDDNLDLSLQVADLLGDDMRPFSKASFKRIFERQAKDTRSWLPLTRSSEELFATLDDPDQPTVVLMFSGRPNKQTVSVKLYNSRTFINLEFVNDLISYLSNVFVGEHKDTAADNQLIEDPVEVRDHNEVKAPIGLVFTFNGELNNSEIILLQNPNDNNTPAIIGRLQANCDYSIHGTNANISLYDSVIELMYGEYPGLRNTSRQLLQPCIIKCSLLMTDKLIDASCHVKEMKFKLSPSILSTIIKIYDSMTGKQLFVDEEYSKEPHNRLDWTAQPLHRNKLIEESNSKINAQLLPIPDKIGTREKVSVGVDMVEVILGNDLKGMFNPLLVAKLSTKTIIQDYSSSVKLEADLTMEVNYFNDTLGVWEPFIEPCSNHSLNIPYELNIRMFYRGSELLDFSSRFLQKEEDQGEEENDSIQGLATDIKDGVDVTTNGSAMFFVISSDDTLQLTVTEKAIEISAHFLSAWSAAALRDTVKTELPYPFHFENELGVEATLYLDSNIKASIAERGEINILRKVKAHAQKKERRLSAFARLSQQGDEADSVAEIDYDNPWLSSKKKRNITVDIEVSGFTVLKNVSLKETGNFVYPLLPQKNGVLYNLNVQIKLHAGQRIIKLTSTLQVTNHLRSPLSIYKTDENGLVEVLQVLPKEIGSIPFNDIQSKTLQVGYKGLIFDDSLNNLQCKTVVIRGQTKETPTTAMYLKVARKNIRCRKNYQRQAEVQMIEVRACTQVVNLLPLKITSLHFKTAFEESSYFTDIEAGDALDIMDINLSETFRIEIKHAQSDGTEWIGQADCRVGTKDPIQVVMTCESKKYTSIKYELSIEKRKSTLELHIYSAFWLVNKTGMNLDFRCDSKEYSLKHTEFHEPCLIYYGSRKKAKGQLSLLGGSWGEAFSLSAVGDESFVICKDKNGVSYPIYVNIVLSHTSVTNIVTLSPQYLAANHTKFDLVFAEVPCVPFNEDESLDWISLTSEKSVPVWLHSSDSVLLLKEKNGALVGPALPFERDYKVAKRLSNCQTVCIDVNHLGERFVMNVTPYEEGSIPLRVDNYCNVPVYVKQRNTMDLTSTFVYPPHTSKYFNWSDYRKPHEVCVMFKDPFNHKKHINITLNGFGKIVFNNNNDATDKSTRESSRRESSRRDPCCYSSCFPCSSCCQVDDDEDEDSCNRLLDESLIDSSFSDTVYWVSYLEGMQRVLAFTTDVHDQIKLRQSGDLEHVTMEIFCSLQGIGFSLLNSVPKEICYISLAGGTSLWEVETKPNVWKAVDIDTATFLEDSFRHSAGSAKFEDKIEVDLREMKMNKPLKGNLRRTCDPALWLQYSLSKSNSSLYLKLHRLQVDSQQYDVTYPSVLYPTPLPPRIIKRLGVKPVLELSVVFSALHGVFVIKYMKVLLQEVNLKVDRALVTGLMSFSHHELSEAADIALYMEDIKLVKESVHKSINAILESQSSKMLISFFHLSPVILHLSFNFEGEAGEGTGSEEELLEWFISTVGIHFTDISDAVIKLGYFERRNVFVTQDMLFADATKHYALQAVKQFHKLVLGLDVLGNPYGLITEYGKGVKDLFYEPYLGSVAGPHQFVEGLATGVKSLLGHTIGGTVGAAALITDQLGQVMAAMTFDSEYKKRRRLQMQKDPSGIGEGLAIGGKQFVLGLVFGISGLVTKPVQGARKGGIEGFFKGVGKGMIGLFVKPTGGVIDLVTSSLDGVKRFAEQGGEDIVCRVRLPRVTYPKEPVGVYSSEKSYGYGLLRSLQSKETIDGYYTDHIAVPRDQPTIVIYTSKLVPCKFYGRMEFAKDIQKHFKTLFSMIPDHKKNNSFSTLKIENCKKMKYK